MVTCNYIISKCMIVTGSFRGIKGVVASPPDHAIKYGGAIFITTEVE